MEIKKMNKTATAAAGVPDLRPFAEGLGKLIGAELHRRACMQDVSGVSEGGLAKSKNCSAGFLDSSRGVR